MSELMMHACLFLSGITFAAFGGAGLFFLRFWKTSRDRFFLLFAIACWLLTAERAVALFMNSTLEIYRTAATEEMAWLYLVRLAAFIVIGVAVWEKNRVKD